MSYEIKTKTKEQLQALTDVRLLNYYKAERGRFFSHGYVQPEEGEPTEDWKLGERYEKLGSIERLEAMSLMLEHAAYLMTIKCELETRKHVK